MTYYIIIESCYYESAPFESQSDVLGVFTDELLVNKKFIEIVNDHIKIHTNEKLHDFNDLLNGLDKKEREKEIKKFGYPKKCQSFNCPKNNTYKCFDDTVMYEISIKTFE